jgi:two-component sensor histidine kinase
MSQPEVEALNRLVDELGALQRESDHRVKNTLQLISSIVMLQSRRSPDDGARLALKAVLQRVTAVSVAQRHVARVKGVEHVDVSTLVRELVGDLAGAAGREGIRVELELEAMAAAARHGAPIALWLSEALGNALRHAFPEGREGCVKVCLRRTPDGVELSVIDDGVGLPGGAAPSGFGMTIIQLLAQQLRGRLDIAPAQPGLRIAVVMPMDEAAP